MKKLINYLTNPNNTIAQYIMAIGTIACIILCASALFIPFICNNTTLVYIIGIISFLFIIYAFTYVVRTWIDNHKTKIQYHQEEVELLQNIFGEIHQHYFYSQINVDFNKRNKKVIKSVLLDFIGDHEKYDTDYYNNLINDCQRAICLIDDLR